MRRREHPQIEMQIAPLIDVCFLLLFFYILTSKPQKNESHLGMHLPGSVEQESALVLPDEQIICVLGNGQIEVNGEPVDSPNGRDLPALRQILSRLKETASANRSQALVSVSVADAATHQRLVDVLNTCAQAGISSVSFAAFPNEEP